MYEPQIIDGRLLRIYVAISSHSQIIASTYKPTKNSFSDTEHFFYDIPLPEKWMLKEIPNSATPKKVKFE